MAFFDFSSLTGRGAFVPSAVMIPQSETERLLGDALDERGVAVEWGCELEHLTQGSTGVTASLRRVDGGREEAAADWLVGCDGAHSVVRRLIGLGFEGDSSPLSFVIADVESPWPSDRESVHVWFHRDGSAAAMPLPGPGRWRLFVETTRQPAATGLDLEDIRRLVSERTELKNVELGRCLWQSEFRISCRMVDRFGLGRVFLAGDAAHIHSPTGGQGIATAVQDVSNLAWKLGQVHRGAPIDLLETYTAERGPEARRVLEETNRNTNVFVAPTPALRLLRDYLFLPLLRSGAAQRRLVRRLSQLDVTYRASALSQNIDERRWRGGTKVRAGDRSPDIVLAADGDAGDTSLFALLRSGRLLALIGCDCDGNAKAAKLAVSLQQLDLAVYAVSDRRPLGDAPPCPALRDRHGELGRLYGMKGEFVCIIRPDGHVGLVQRPIRMRPIRDWLARLYPAGSVRAAFASLSPDA